MARKWRGLNWRDPRADLVRLGLLESHLQRQGTLVTHDDLRRRELRELLYLKQAALFSHMVSQAIVKAPVRYAMFEDEDYDCVIRWRGEGSPRARVQLKECVPHLSIRRPTSLEHELAKLGKYPTSSQTIVAMHVNQTGPVVLSDVKPPKCGFAEIWLYSAITPDQSHWSLYGDLLNARRQEFVVPWPTTLLQRRRRPEE
jgi:hypothetical protein